MEIDNADVTIGWRYVAQGSTLGGQVISKHLQRALGLVPQQTNHFFAGFGEQTGAKWKAFTQQLENPALHHEAVVAACIASAGNSGDGDWLSAKGVC